jgi:uncharacterized spore protein YtfJ
VNEVQEIRILALEETVDILSERYEVVPGTIKSIIKHRSWKTKEPRLHEEVGVPE